MRTARAELALGAALFRSEAVNYGFAYDTGQP